MNKNGFTLVELLAVITLVTILAGLAIPNVVSSINNSRKSTFLLDAKRMVAKAEYYINKNRNDKNQATSSGKIYEFSRLNENGDFNKDADGGSYDTSTFVKVYKESSKLKYCICVIGSKKKIVGSSGTCSTSNTTPGTGCVLSDNLIGIDIVLD